MKGVFLLALRFIRYYRVRTGLLVLCLTLNLYLPAAVHMVVGEFQRMSAVRAKDTPLVIGAKGSRFGLAIHALHFRGDSPEAIPMSELSRVQKTDLSKAIPLFVRFRARGNVIVGTAPEYFAFRELEMGQGASFQRLGDCVLGFQVAMRLGIGPGDVLLTDAENVFDISGPTPMNLRVTGVLEPSQTVDDEVVFVALNSAWILQGIGHGHETDETSDESVATSDEAHKHGASRSNLKSHAEVTAENVESFHFHGNKEKFPLTAIIAIPKDEKSEALLMGRYLSTESNSQAIKPSEVLDELMGIIFKAKRVFNFGIILLSVVTVMLIALVIALSLRLRKRELETMSKLGCSRYMVFWLQTAELSIVIALSMVMTCIFLWITHWVAQDLIRGWIV